VKGPRGNDFSPKVPPSRNGVIRPLSANQEKAWRRLREAVLLLRPDQLDSALHCHLLIHDS